MQPPVPTPEPERAPADATAPRRRFYFRPPADWATMSKADKDAFVEAVAAAIMETRPTK
jgi:hypothetical protein